MTGRVSCLVHNSCSAPPPLPYDVSERKEAHVEFGSQGVNRSCGLQWTIDPHQERAADQKSYLNSLPPNQALYFFCLVDLAQITHAITNRVYSAEIVHNERAHLESRIRLYSKKTEQWVAGLPFFLTFQDSKGKLIQEKLSSFQVSLALHYYSARILLNRPCLTRPDIDEETGIRFPRTRFGNDTAVDCLRAALALLAVLPDQPDTVWAYNIAPFWSFLHFLMQATVVLLIHLSIGSVPVRAGAGKANETGEGATGTPESPEVILAVIKKALHWLHNLGKSEEASRRAFELCNSCFCRIAPSKGMDLSDISSRALTSQSSRKSLHPQHSGIIEDTKSLSTKERRKRSQDSGEYRHPESRGHQVISHDEGSESLLFQDPQDAQTTSQWPHISFAMLERDIDMPDLVSHPTDASLDELLFLLIGSNE